MKVGDMNYREADALYEKSMEAGRKASHMWEHHFTEIPVDAAKRLIAAMEQFSAEVEASGVRHEEKH